MRQFISSSDEFVSIVPEGRVFKLLIPKDFIRFMKGKQSVGNVPNLSCEKERCKKC